MEKIFKEAIENEAILATRRHFLNTLGTGIGSLALGSALWNCQTSDKAPHSRFLPILVKQNPLYFYIWLGRLPN